MKYFLFLLFSYALPLFGASIGNVKYDLPKTKQGWQRIVSNDDPSGVDYIPANKTLKNSNEFFGVHISNLSPSDINEFAIKAMVQAQIGREAKVLIIEKTPNSVLYEWGMDDMYGFLFSLNRIFFSESGSTLLMYQTSAHKRVDADKGLWLAALRAACISQQDRE